jgi:hypothetical protein
MRNALRTALKRHRLAQARALAFLMLAGIVYHATFGTVHSHTDISSPLSTSSFVGSVGESGAFSQPPRHSNTGHDECLICRFHQQLFNSVIDGRIFVAEPSRREIRVHGEAFFDYPNSFAPTPISRHSGRAPPLA